MKTISEEEYQNILNRLLFIQKERETLKKINSTLSYQAHIKLAATFPELLINIQRENEQLDQKIKNEQKKYLITFQYSKKIYSYLENKINYLIAILETNPNLTLKEDPELIAISNNYPNFKQFFENIKELISQKEANIYLRDYVQNLEREEKEITIQKNKYEKKNKKLIKRKKSNTKTTPLSLKHSP